MFHAILLVSVLMLADGGKPADASASDRAAYEAAAAKAGKNAAAHVKLALWCETHGLSAERIKHLSIASTLDPSNVLARGLLGLVAFQGKWTKPDQVEKQIRDDPKFQAVFREYLRSPRSHAPEERRRPVATRRLVPGKRTQGRGHGSLSTWSPASTPPAISRGSASAIRKPTTAGSSPTTWLPRNSRPIDRSTPIRSGGRDWKNCETRSRARLRPAG